MKKSSVTAVQCPRCGIADSRVSLTARLDDGLWVRRRRCTGCGKSIYTRQAPEELIDSSRIIWSVGCSNSGRVAGLRDAPEIDGKIKNVTN